MQIVQPFRLLFKMGEMHHHPFQGIPLLRQLQLQRSFSQRGRKFHGRAEHTAERLAAGDPCQVHKRLPEAVAYQAELVVLFGGFQPLRDDGIVIDLPFAGR